MVINNQLQKTVAVSNSIGQLNVRALKNKFGEVLVRRKQQNQLEKYHEPVVEPMQMVRTTIVTTIVA